MELKIEEKSISTSRLENVVTPWWIRWIPMVTWRKKSNSEKKVYLTFDDGPTKDVTRQILADLRRFNAKATFFCIGENVENHPDLLEEMISSGHMMGNHSHRHLNGWKTKTRTYVNDVLECQATLTDRLGHEPKLFRPPFGRISFGQMLRLRKRFEIVLWDILAMDYRIELSGQQVANNVIENAKNGSIVLLHDSDLAQERVSIALPKILQHFSDSGFQMCRLDE